MKNLKTKLVSVLAAAVMAIGLLPAQAASNTVTIANTKDYDYITETNPAGSNFLVMQSSASNIEKGSYVEYHIYAEDEGVYNIVWKGNRMAGSGYVSAMTLSVNGAVIPNETVQITKVYDENFADQIASVKFNAGINVIRFKLNNIPESRSDNMGIFQLESLSVVPVSANTINENGTLIVEAQNYIAGSHALTECTDNATSCYGGSFYYPGVITSRAVSYSYSVYADAPGNYDMTVYASNRVNWLGRFEVLVNGVSVGNSEAGGAFDKYKAHVGGNDTWFIRRHNPITVRLNEGENTVVIRSHDKGTNSNYGFALDCFKFAPKTAGTFYYEGEAASGDPITGGNGAGFSNDSWNRVWESNQNAITTFNVPAGDYELQMALGADIDLSAISGGRYLGTAAISIDGGEPIALTGENCEILKTWSEGSDFRKFTGIWKYKPGLPALTEGTHTLQILCTGKGSAGSNNLVVFDYFELIPSDRAVGDVTLTTASNKVAVGSTLETAAKLYYASGYEYNESLIESVAFTSSNTNVATVDENGVITGQNPGVATITVTFNGEHTATAKVSVYDESGIVPVSAAYDEEKAKVTLKFTRIEEGTGTAAAFIGAYAQENGTDTSFTDAQLAEGINPARSRVVTVTKPISGDKITAFVWNSVAGMKPICDEITVK